MNPNTIDSIIKQLIASHTTISTMESCTSGLIASLTVSYTHLTLPTKLEV